MFQHLSFVHSNIQAKYVDFFAYGEIVFGHAFKVSKYLSLG